MISIQAIADISLSEVLRRSPVAGKPDAERILRECVYRSTQVRYGFVDGEIAAMWGLIPPTLLSSSAYLWLLTTEIAAEHKFLLVRHSQRWIEDALKVYPTIVGDVGNPAAKRWLAWLGAEFSEDGLKFKIERRVLHG